MKLDFDQLDPEGRRLILVASDAKYKSLMEQIDPIKVLKLAASVLMHGGLVGSFFGAAAVGSAYLATTWATVDAIERKRGKAGPSLYERLLTKGEIPIPHLTPEEAARRFRFDFSDPQDGAAYVLSPCAPNHYLRPAIANERLAQEKLAAFIKIASSLGAKRIEILSADTASEAGKSGGSAPLPKAAAQVGISAHFEQGSLANRQVFMEFDEPHREPSVPDDLRRWLEVDPVLQSLVETRLTGRPRVARIAIQFGELIDIRSDITGELARRGLKVGGDYRRVTQSTWSFEIEYWPAAPPGLVKSGP